MAADGVSVDPVQLRVKLPWFGAGVAVGCPGMVGPLTTWMVVEVVGPGVVLLPAASIAETLTFTAPIGGGVDVPTRDARGRRARRDAASRDRCS